MIIDTSAVLAILFEEEDAEVYANAISRADSCRMSAANFTESGIVIDHFTKDRGSRLFDAFIRRARITIEPVSEEQAHVARQAYADFAKGQHPARLNFGDCFAYACAKANNARLLYKGDDFAQTDLA